MLSESHTTKPVEGVEDIKLPFGCLGSAQQHSTLDHGTSGEKTLFLHPLHRPSNGFDFVMLKPL